MKALFVLRHHNDFDSLAPVIDGWVRLSHDHRAMVYISSPELKWRGDYRTAMLEETGRVTFADMWAVAGLGDGGSLARRWQRLKPGMKISRKFLQWATELSAAPGFSAKIRKLLDDFSPDIIAFDFYHIPRRRKILGFYGYQDIVAWMQSHKRPLVSLPHGLQLFVFGEEKFQLPAHYAAIFVESQRKKSMFDDSLSEKIVVSGSARYDPHWVVRVAAVLDKDIDRAPQQSGKTKIVFFATKANYFVFPQLLSWLFHLSSHQDVELIIQPHPRGQKESAFAAIAGLPNVHIDARTPASRLIGDADIVSTLVSSVMVDAVVRGREILYPDFLNAAATQFDEVGACIALSCMEDTHPAIDNYRKGLRVPKTTYDAFLQQFAYGGGDPHTINRICAQLQKLALAACRG